MKRIFLTIAAASLLLGSCKKFIDVNDNPNTPGSSRSDFQFGGAVGNTTQTLIGEGQLTGAWTGIYGFSTSFTGAGQQKTYVFANTDFNYFDGIYDNITDYNYVIANGAREGYAHLIGPSMIMKAFQFQRLVDLYNNVPYSQAFNIVGDVTPDYDAGQAIYEDLIKQLDAAIVQMKATTFPTSAPEDIVFAGNKTNWIKMANTLKLRLLINQSEIPGRDAYITGEINKIATEGTGFLTVIAAAKPGYVKQTGKLNPLYANMGYNENDVESGNHRLYKINSYLLNFLIGTNDAFRFQRKADMKVQGNDGNKNNPANYVGVNLGQRSGATETVVSSIGSALITRGDATRPFILITASEPYFLQAEAAQRYGLLGSAVTNFTNGVIESFKLDAGIGHAAAPTATTAEATAAANAYIAANATNNDVNFVASTNKIRTIIFQKWLGQAYHDNITAWNDWRRTGYPIVPVSDQAQATQPRRLYYPLSELNTNAENLAKQGTISPYTGRVFWDRR